MTFVLILGLVYAAASHAESLQQPPPSEGAVREQLLAQMGLSRSSVLPAPGVVRWEQADLATMSDQELAELRRAVVGKPEHPGRATIENETNARAGKLKWEWTLAWKDNARWRFDIRPLSVGEAEAVVLGERPWRQYGSTLSLYVSDLKAAAADKEQRPQKAEQLFFPVIDRFINGGLRLYPSSVFDVASVSVREHGWAAVLRSKPLPERSGAVSVALTGGWLVVEGAPKLTISSRTIEQNDARKEFVGDRELYEGWRVDQTGQLHASLIRQYRPNGTEWRRYAWVDECPTLQEVDFRPPEPGRPAVGLPSVARVYDFAKGTVRTEGEAAVSMFEVRGEPRRGTVRTGWILLGVSAIVVCGLIWKFRRK